MRRRAIVLAGFIVLAGCKARRIEPSSSVPAPEVTVHSAEVERASRSERTGLIERVDVPGDRSVLVVGGASPRPIVYLHGMCSDPGSDLEVWGTSVSERGTVIALEGDIACSRGRTFTADIDVLDARIEGALVATSADRRVLLAPREIILIGESLGASRTTSLAAQFPAKYTRLVLVGGPKVPSTNELAGARAVALLAGEREYQGTMQKGASNLASAGIPARFWELADATHGTYGSDGGRVVADAVDFVAAH